MYYQDRQHSLGRDIRERTASWEVLSFSSGSRTIANFILFEAVRRKLLDCLHLILQSESKAYQVFESNN